MTTQRWNALKGLQSIRHLIRHTGAVTADISYWKYGADGNDTPARSLEADYGTVSLTTDLNEVFHVHNFTVDGKGTKLALACMEEILNEMALWKQELTQP